MNPLFSFARPSSRASHSQAGFTLIEFMASMSIFAIVVVSVLSMQSTSLNTYANVQDFTEANALADQSIETVQLDGSRWQQVLNTDLLTEANRSLKSAPVRWLSFTNRPVNFQMSDVMGANSSGARARFCVFYSYRYAGEEAAAGSPDMLEINVVVLWPTTFSGLPLNFATFFNACGTGGSGSANTYIDASQSLWGQRTFFRQVRRVSFVRRNRVI